MLGGLATAGLIYFYLPLCDGRGRQVTFGVSEELLHRSLLYPPPITATSYCFADFTGNSFRFVV